MILRRDAATFTKENLICNSVKELAYGIMPSAGCKLGIFPLSARVCSYTVSRGALR
jgi:hypothetical protein